MSVTMEHTTSYPHLRIQQGTVTDEIFLVSPYADEKRLLPADVTSGPLRPPTFERGGTQAVNGKIVGVPQHLSAVPLSDDVSAELKRIRALTALSVSDIAQLCGIKRRHIYNLLEGEPTGPHRAALIRAILTHIERWADLYKDAITLRSVLLAPLDHEGLNFLSLASAENDPAAVQSAAYRVDRYIERLEGRRPVARITGQIRSGAIEAGQILRELHGERELPAGTTRT